jgi:hypothetical protein
VFYAKGTLVPLGVRVSDREHTHLKKCKLKTRVRLSALHARACVICAPTSKMQHPQSRQQMQAVAAFQQYLRTRT